MSSQSPIQTEIRIRGADRPDRPFIKELLRESMSLVLADLLVNKPRAFERRVDEQFRTYYDRHDKVIWVATAGEEPIGYIWLQPMYDPLVDVRSYLVINVGVQAEYRRRGVAGQLFQHARESACRQGISRLRLFVYGTNHVAKRLYKKLGFSVGFIEMNWDFPLPGAEPSDP